jgi:hypothetical protein
MSPRRTSLNCLGEKLKTFFPKEKEFKLPQGAIETFFSLRNYHVPREKELELP